MPPSVSSAKTSPTAAAAAAPDIDLKDLDDLNTHTSESVCSSSGTDADTTAATNSPHAMLHPPPRLTAHAAVKTALDVSAVGGILSDYARSPTSPMPCGFPEDFVSAVDGSPTTTITTTSMTAAPSAVEMVDSDLAMHPARTAALVLGCSTVSSSTPSSSPTDTAARQLNSPPIAHSAKKTPAPPPPIDFCGLVRPSPTASANGLPPPLCQREGVKGTPEAASESGLLSPSSAAPAVVSLSNASGGGGAAVKSSTSPSTLHASSEPFHPLERGGLSTSNGGAAAAAASAGGSGGGGPGYNALGHVYGPEGYGANNNNSNKANVNTSSLMSTPHQGYASSSDYHPLDRRLSPCTIGFGLGDDFYAGGGGPPRLTNSPARHMAGPPGLSGGSGNMYDVHWQDTGSTPYYFSHFTHAPATTGPNLESSLGGFAAGGGGNTGPLVEDGFGYTPPMTSSPASNMHSTGTAPWASVHSAATSPCSMAVSGQEDGVPPVYTEPQPPFFHDGPPPPLLPAEGLADYDYQDGRTAYEDASAAAFGEPEMRFGSYVPQNVQCVEQLEELDYICQGLLSEASVLQQQYQRRCRERQYLAEDAYTEEDEDQSKLVVALDLEGRSLGRTGSICIITLATYSTVYIIDMVLLGAQALADNSALTEVLESPLITKLMFDCRADCDALFFLYHVRLRSVCDLQISSCFALFPMTRHLPGMKDVFRALGLFADEDTDIKNAGRHLFNPESGGSFDRWEERPLTEILLQYCAVDVKYFFLAKLMLWDHLEKGFCLGEARLASVCAGHFVGCSKGNSLRDFNMQ